jgi:hypothetical protein
MTKRPKKFEKRLPLDMNFDEALGRFAQMEPAEIDAPLSGRVRLQARPDSAHPLLIYVADGGSIRVELPWKDGNLWATQDQMASMFGVNVPAISKHLKNIFAEGELREDGTLSSLESVGVSGQTYSTRLYNLNAIISVGYRIESKTGTMFRMWATDKLIQILTKGFYVDQARLMNEGEPDALQEFKQIARQIRTSIRNSYREVLNLCKLSADYDGKSDTAQEFFMAMENKLLWAAANKTAPQIILERADADKPDMGLTCFAGKRGPTQRDVVISNNYLAPGEQERKGRITEMWLTYVEEQLDQGRLPTMQAIIELLDGFIRFNRWRVLDGKGHHSRNEATKHARLQLEHYRERLGVEAEAGSFFLPNDQQK